MRLVGKNVVIYGAGISGLAAYELVREKGAKAIIYDDDATAEHATSSKGVFDGADVIVLSPGVDADKDFLLDARLDNTLVISELSLASKLCDAEQIAITGTNGKTTTTMLIDYILKRAGLHSHAVGNIGVPFCSIADKLDATEIAVIEASSFQLENSPDFSPEVSVLLNIAPDHLSRHKTMQNYINAKANILRSQSEQDIAVYNADDEIIAGIIEQTSAKKVPFSIERIVKDGAYLSSGFACYKGRPVVALDEIDFKGKEVQNVLASIAVCMEKGVSAFCVASAITDFAKPRYRREFTAKIRGISVYNDSKSTNVSACLCACESVEDCVLILGGQKGEEDFDKLFSDMPAGVKGFVACGENADDIYAEAKGNGFEVSVRESLADALDCALKKAEEAGVKNVLFSPASKSFDKYKNFEERGRVFDAVAKKLAR